MKYDEVLKALRTENRAYFTRSLWGNPHILVGLVGSGSVTVSLSDNEGDVLQLKHQPYVMLFDTELKYSVPFTASQDDYFCDDWCQVKLDPPKPATQGVLVDSGIAPGPVYGC